jgi:hypothetical protein
MPRSSSSSSSHRTAPLSKPSAVVPFQNPLSSVSVPNRLEIQQPTLGQSLKQGFGFGAGSAIAHRFFGATPTILAPSQPEVKPPCDKERTAFETCMKTKSTDDFCGDQQMAYTQCIRLSKESS